MPASSGPAAPAPAAAEAPVEEKPKEKTIFTVKLEKIDPAQKAKVIREVKAMMPNMNLVEVSRIPLRVAVMPSRQLTSSRPRSSSSPPHRS